MTFSEFAKLLSKYCANGETTVQFMQSLTNHIMVGRPGRSHQGGGHQNPLLGKDEDTLRAYFNGTRSISQSDAQILFSSIYPYRFEQFVESRCSEAAQQLLAEELAKSETLDKNRRVSEICADLFVAILEDLADKSK